MNTTPWSTAARSSAQSSTPSPSALPSAPMPPPPAVVPIDPTGDVIFLVASTTKLRVSSKILSLASPAFASMLSERFTEGQNLSVDSPPEIPLPDDDAETAGLLFLVLHHRDLDRRISTKQLISLVALADKYLCLRANLAVQLRMMLTSVRETFEEANYWSSLSPAELYQMLVVAYKLKSNVHFRKLSATIMLRFRECRQGPDGEKAGDNLEMERIGLQAGYLMPDKVADLLRQGARMHRDHLVEALHPFSVKLSQQISPLPSGLTLGGSSSPEETKETKRRDPPGWPRGHQRQAYCDFKLSRLLEWGQRLWEERATSTESLIGSFPKAYILFCSDLPPLPFPMNATRREVLALVTHYMAHDIDPDERRATWCKVQLMRILEKHEKVLGLCLDCVLREGKVVKGSCSGRGWHSEGEKLGEWSACDS